MGPGLPSRAGSGLVVDCHRQRAAVAQTGEGIDGRFESELAVGVLELAGLDRVVEPLCRGSIAIGPWAAAVVDVLYELLAGGARPWPSGLVVADRSGRLAAPADGGG